MPTSLQLGAHIAATPTEVFELWTSSAKHTAMCGDIAVIDARVGGAYSLFAGSITGEFVFIERPNVLAMTWRTHDFGPRDDYARTELRFRPSQIGTLFEVHQDLIPSSMFGQFTFGWKEHYFPKMQTFFLANRAPAQA